ncbi:MAG TPA: hypothetical protein VFF50_12745 [Candidatus Deferrimicrobiaceae bacterium]|nr:hypothetical protein [Candidatus Deferrimicrobiaceae bacterium]
MAAFPHTLRIDLFYGPLVCFLGSLDVRLFGLSATSWRLLGFMGATGTVFAASWVSRCLDRSPVVMAAAAMLVTLSQGMGARATSGRLDAITVMLELLSLACALRTMQVHELKRSLFVYAPLAGVFCGLAALSTPRAFPFIMGLFVALGLESVSARKPESVARTLIIGTTALLPVWAWTLSRGISPIGWLRLIAVLSRGDKLSVSPMLHGSWHFFDEPLVPLASGLLFTFVMVLVFGSAIVAGRRILQTEGRDVSSAIKLASIGVFINYVASFLTIARFWDYEIFVVPLVIPILIAWTAKLLRSNGPSPLARIVVGSWLILAIVLVTIRSGKVVAWLVSYDERNPQPLHDFVSRHVPSNSRVFGPEDYYFYAVEAAGSHYRFLRPRITSGLVSKLDHDLDWREQLNDGRPVYLIWPKGDPLPHNLVQANLLLEASFAAKLGKEPARWRKAGWGSGYPPTNLYRIVDNPSAEKGPVNKRP